MMKKLHCALALSLLLINISCTSDKAQVEPEKKSADKPEGVVCTSDGVCIVPSTNPSSLVPPVAGSGPSFKPGTRNREGKIVEDKKSGAKPYPKQLWADSYLFRELPLLSEEGEILKDQRYDDNLSSVDRIKGFLKIESWYNHPPADCKGKFVLIEFAASWCTACKRSLKHIEHFHETFPDKLVVISVFETGAQQNDDFPKPGAGRNIKHCIGIDTQRRCADALGVYGIPHAVLLEPEAGVVVWEGMVHQIGYELTDELLRKFFAIGLKK